MPGIGDVGGMTGGCAPGGNTGVPGGVTDTDGNDPTAPAGCGVTGPKGTAGAEVDGDAAEDAGSGGVPIVAGGPVNDMLLCVPM
jgi:hypothetical protein